MGNNHSTLAEPPLGNNRSAGASVPPAASAPSEAPAPAASAASAAAVAVAPAAPAAPEVAAPAALEAAAPSSLAPPPAAAALEVAEPSSLAPAPEAAAPAAGEDAKKTHFLERLGLIKESDTYKELIVFGDIETKKVPFELQFVGSKISLIISGLPENASLGTIGDWVKGFGVVHKMKLLYQAAEDGILSPSWCTLGNRDFNLARLGLELAEKNEFGSDQKLMPAVQRIKTKMLALLPVDGSSMTLGELKKSWHTDTKGDNEPYVDLINPADRSSSVKKLFIEEIRSGLSADTLITQEFVNNAFEDFSKGTQEQKEATYIQFSCNSCHGFPQGYEKLIISEWVDFIKDKLEKECKVDPEKQDPAINLLQTLYSQLENEQLSAEAMILALNAIISNASAALDLSTVSVLPANLLVETPQQTRLHARVKTFLTSFSEHKLVQDSSLAHNQVKLPGSQQSIILQHQPSKTPGISQDILLEGTPFSVFAAAFRQRNWERVKIFTRLHQPRPRSEHESIANITPKLGYAAGEVGQKPRVSGHKPVLLSMITDDQHVFLDNTLNSNNGLIESAAHFVTKTGSDGTKTTYHYLKEQTITLPRSENCQLLDDPVETINTIPVVYELSEDTRPVCKAGLPAFDLPFPHMRSDGSIEQFIKTKHEMFPEQARVCAWRNNEAGNMIAIIGAQGNQRDQYKKVVQEVTLGDLLAQINGLHNVPGLFNSVVARYNTLSEGDKAAVRLSLNHCKKQLTSEQLEWIRDHADNLYKDESLTLNKCHQEVGASPAPSSSTSSAVVAPVASAPPPAPPPSSSTSSAVAPAAVAPAGAPAGAAAEPRREGVPNCCPCLPCFSQAAVSQSTGTLSAPEPSQMERYVGEVFGSQALPGGGEVTGPTVLPAPQF